MTDVDVHQQLKDLKRLVAYLMVRDGRQKIRIPVNVLDQIPDSAEIIVWQDPTKLELGVEIRDVPPVFGIDVLDAEVVEEPPTFRHEAHPELPGVVRPVMDKPVRMDPATGVVEW